MDILLWLVFGGLAGWLASIIMGANAHMGIVMNIIVGIVGAMIGGFIASVTGIGSMSGFNITSFILAVLGAVILLWLIQMVTNTGRTHNQTL